MSEYSKVVRTFWSGPTGRVLRSKGRDVQFLALYVFTGPSVHQSGLYYVALPTMCHEAGFTPEELRKTLAVLADVGFAHYDEAQELMWVPEMATYQIEETLKPEDKRVKGVLAWLRQFREHPFGQAFYERYREAYHLPSEGFRKPLRRASQGASKGLGRPSEAITEQNKQNKQNIPEQASSGAAAPPAAPSSEGASPTTAKAWSQEAADDFREAYKADPPEQYFGQVKPIARKYGWDRTRPALQAYLRDTPIELLNIPKVLPVRIEGGHSMAGAGGNGSAQALARAGPGGTRAPTTAAERTKAAAERYLERRGKAGPEG